MKNIVPFLFACIVLFQFSCKTDDEGLVTVKQVGKEYYPLSLEQESIYEIDSILYNDFTGRVDTFYLQRRELVESKFTDQQERESYVVGIYERSADSLPWTKRKVILKTVTSQRAEMLEDNEIVLPLVFPVADEKTWNANALNTEDELRFTYGEVNQAYSLENTDYDSTLIVYQQDEENLIERKFSTERYALHVGLIEREVIDLETELNGEIRSGFKATTRLISFK